jgi:hypothetical protein
MTEPTLSLTYSELTAEVAEYLGHGRSPSGDALAEARRCVQDGYARFLAGLDPRTGRGYRWSFLTPTADLTLYAPRVAGGATVSGSEDDGLTTLTASEASFAETMAGREIEIDGVGSFPVVSVASPTQMTVLGDAACAAAAFAIDAAGRYTLPADFAGLLEGPVFLPGASLSVPCGGLRAMPAGALRRLASRDDRAATPRFFALLPQPFDATVGQRWQLRVHPRPSGDVTVRLRYHAAADALSADADRPRGGSVHARTVLQCALAAAEGRRFETAGVQSELAEARLCESIDLDAAGRPARRESDAMLPPDRGTVRYS